MKRNIKGGAWNNGKEMQGETVYMPEAFGINIKSGKSPKFGRIKANACLKHFNIPPLRR
jgi:hypothetical protein